MSISRDRIVIYVACKPHGGRNGEARERECADCRRLTFRASMRARGITVSVPTYPGVKGTPNGYAATTDGGKPWTPISSSAIRQPGEFQYPERIPGWS